MKDNGSAGNTRLHKIWRGMRSRCTNQNNTGYVNYGGRGITVCSDWDTFTVFAEWANNNGYTENLSIDRVNNDEGYSPDNCRWATQTTQSRNTRRIHTTNKSGYRGVSWSKQMSRWEVSIGVDKKTIKVGYYTDVLVAAKAYDSYVLKHKLEHTVNNVLHKDEYVEANANQLLLRTNTSGYVGVGAPKRIQHMTNPYTAAISIQDKKVFSGYFKLPWLAALARDSYIHLNCLTTCKLNFT